MKSVFSNMTFINILVLTAATGASVEILRLALPLIAFEIRHSSADVSMLRAVWFTPNLILAIFAGVINDRFRKKLLIRLYMYIQLASIVLMAFIPAVSSSLFALSALSFCLMTANYSLVNAQNSVVQQAIPAAQLVNANAYLSSQFSVISVCAPVVAGLLVEYSHQAALVVPLALMAVGTVSALFMDLDEIPSKEPFVRALKDGFREFVANRPLVLMTVCMMIANGTEGVYTALLIEKVAAATANDSFVLGTAFAFAGLGSILGSALTPLVRKRIGVWTTFSVPIGATGIIYLMIAGTDSIPLLCGLTFLEGVISSLMIVTLWSFRQETTDRRLMGRVAGITGSIFKLGVPPMIILFGVVATNKSVAFGYTAIGIINVVTCLSVSILGIKLAKSAAFQK